MSIFKNMAEEDFNEEYLSLFDAVYSSSYYESEKLGLRYIDEPLRKFSYPDVQQHQKVFFCGRDKGRLPLLKDIGKYLLSHGIDCEFLVLRDEKNKNFKNGDGIQYIEYIPYDIMIKKAQESSCLLGLIGEHTSMPACSFRESIMYNKKFLTNAQNIHILPHYNGKYQKTISTIEDIDIDWICNNENVQYNYSGYFELKYFFETIKNDYTHGLLRRLVMMNRRILHCRDKMPHTQYILYRKEKFTVPANKGALLEEDISDIIPYGYIPRVAFARATGSNHLYYYFIEVTRLKKINIQIRNTSNKDVVANPSIWIVCEKKMF